MWRILGSGDYHMDWRRRLADRGKIKEEFVAKHRVLGISFDHMHIGDLLRQVCEHPNAEIAGIYDPDPARITRLLLVPSVQETKLQRLRRS